MPDLDVTEFATYEEFAQEWDAPNSDTQMLWQLLGQLEDEELLIEIPEWLAEENIRFVDGAMPTVFIGQVDEETEKAIQFIDSASTRSLMKLAHRIHNLEQNEDDTERNEWLDSRLKKHRAAFKEREDAVTLKEEWLPKSQLLRVVRRE